MLTSITLTRYTFLIKSLEEENSSLKKQLEHLKQNLLMNKNLVTKLTVTSAPDEQKSAYVSHLKRENDNLYQRLDELQQEIENEVKQRQSLEKKLSDVNCTNPIEKFENEIFALRQDILKKDNMIKSLNYGKVRAAVVSI